MDKKDQMLSEIINSIGVSYQLLVTRFGQIVGDDLLPFPQFIMLSHFMKDPKRERTVSSVASAFQAPQPGITKTVQKLVHHKLAEERVNSLDGRSKLIFITKKGINAYQSALKQLAPDIRNVFSVMDDAELDLMFRCLTKLRVWLDDNRHNVVAAKDKKKTRGKF